jgi:hypothetical protein
MSVAIRIECHGEVVLEAAFDEDPTRVSTADPGPGTIKSNVLTSNEDEEDDLTEHSFVSTGVFAYTGQHDGAPMSELHGTGGYKRLAASLQASQFVCLRVISGTGSLTLLLYSVFELLQACKVETERVLTKSIDKPKVPEGGGGGGGGGGGRKDKQKRASGGEQLPSSKRAS